MAVAMEVFEFLKVMNTLDLTFWKLKRCIYSQIIDIFFMFLKFVGIFIYSILLVFMIFVAYPHHHCCYSELGGGKLPELVALDLVQLLAALLAEAGPDKDATVVLENATAGVKAVVVAAAAATNVTTAVFDKSDPELDDSSTANERSCKSSITTPASLLPWPQAKELITALAPYRCLGQGAGGGKEDQQVVEPSGSGNNASCTATSGSTSGTISNFSSSSSSQGNTLHENREIDQKGTVNESNTGVVLPLTTAQVVLRNAAAEATTALLSFMVLSFMGRRSHLQVSSPPSSTSGATAAVPRNDIDIADTAAAVAIEVMILNLFIFLVNYMQCL
jgi:hypothetical protein